MTVIIDFLKHNFFIFEIFLCYIPYVVLLKPRKYFWVRLAACMTVCVLFSCFLPQRINAGEVLKNIYNMFGFIMTICLTIAGLKICFKDSWLTLILCGISAYSTQHIFFRLRMLTLLTLNRLGWFSEWLFAVLYCIELGGLLALLYFFLVRKLKKQAEFKVNNVRVVALTITVIIIVIVLNNISMIEMFSMDWGALYAFNLYVIFACLFLLFNLFSNANSKAMQQEMDIIQNLWVQDRRQYEVSKQNIELLNMKFHDLKYYINNNLVDKADVKEISRCLDIYDSVFRTGNKTLDVVLTERKLICDSKDITFTCLAEGDLLNGMNAGDIYSVFGNAIDNAIECLDGTSDNDKKFINVMVKRLNGMVRIQIENFTPNTPEINNGFPETTKSDKANHGYGLKSMYYIVEKYKGAMNISVEDNVFRLNIILPT